MSEGLDGFAEAHVIGEDAVKLVLAEELKPAKAIELIGPEVGSKLLRWIDFREAGDVAELAAEFGEGAQGFGVVERELLGYGGGGEAVDFKRAIVWIATVEEVADGAA